MATTPAEFKRRLMAGDPLVGVFVKTPAIEVVETLAMCGFDWLCLDTEHAPIDRRSMDAPLAIARAFGLPMMVRVATAAPAPILQALDCGAVGVLVPHVDSPAKARDVARWAHFGEGGRGYAGSTRWAGYAGVSITENLKRDLDETIVMAQVEDAAALQVIDEIAATPGIDSLFVGPADFAVALGGTSPTDQVVLRAYDAVAAAAKRHRRNLSTFAATPEIAQDLRKRGVSAFLVGSEHGLMLTAGRALTSSFRP